MEAGLEHFDMGLVNYRQHPTNQNYIVYRFKDKLRAETFEQLLNESKIRFERSDPEPDEKELYLFAVEKKYFEKTQKLNFITESKHKRFLIPNNFFRYLFVLIMLGILTLSTLGYCESRKKLDEETKKIESAFIINRKTQRSFGSKRLF
jgi:hypothetical protein